MDVCIDLETGSTTPNAAILAIGACIFDPYSFAITDTLSVGIDPPSNDLTHRAFSGETLAWWSCQPDALLELSKLKLVALHQALRELHAFLALHKPLHVWANSPSFDVVILRHAFQQHDLQFPIPFYNERDVRTIKALLPTDLHPPFEGTKHAALDDAKHQARLVQTALSTLHIQRNPP